MTDQTKAHGKSIVVAITTALTLLGGTEGISMIRSGGESALTKADVKEVLMPITEKLSDQGRTITEIRAKVDEFDRYMAVQRDRETRRNQAN